MPPPCPGDLRAKMNLGLPDEIAAIRGYRNPSLLTGYGDGHFAVEAALREVEDDERNAALAHATTGIIPSPLSPTESTRKGNVRRSTALILDRVVEEEELARVERLLRVLVDGDAPVTCVQWTTTSGGAVDTHRTVGRSHLLAATTRPSRLHTARPWP